MIHAIISDQVHANLEEACKQIKELGYSNIELHNVFGKSIEECSDTEVDEIKKILNSYDMQVANIASTIFFLCPLYPNYKVSLFNPTFYAIEGDVKKHLEYLERACEIAIKLKCQTVRIFPFRFPDNEEVVVVGTDDDIQKIIEYLKMAVKIAEKYGVILVLENCPYSHLPKGEMTMKVIEAIASPNLKLLWDPANSYRAEKHKVPKKYLKRSLENEYDLIHDKIRHIHLKNYQYDKTSEKPFLHRALLEGDIDYQKLLQRINKNYQYYISLEPEVDYEKTIQSMKELLTLI
ncbi:sugar phosphate isomerase/epimerase [Breznakia sp. PF5-3]|uniref:sugar phosphate isomerase/epimerase family protein n=1 Tax=unclassified Breznakia TaxID=2623764 RepID=UPI002404F497|nr:MULTISPECIES: sugar phosphate isomerase/epimerase family protein [unclassified Breznakia]MDF9824946.1 sugar phosphate isomerase/epimerase [Breznakia sp. PM6-1]MDF9835786.1 sugar phosphate isomerase/epimerase [Breznakia sp. PF5-3]MDF9837920.1 sugar phosphate isomerase/epimerase [Breznakia sp. PFB2-8]MDF9859909.1 sugar phosphate isomerase/epimerase [Breznakia sp. PH5-24]